MTGYRGRPMVGVVYDVDEPPASRLWRIREQRHTCSRIAVADIPAAALNPSISRPTAGQPARLAFQTIARDVDLHLMDLDARLVNDTTRVAALFEFDSHRGFGPILARRQPDCVRVAPFRSPEVGSLNPMEADFGRSRHCGAAGVSIGGWSPDGTDRVRSGSCRSDVYLVGADGGHLRRLTAEPSIDGVPSWSGDGRWIISHRHARE